jgi:arginase
MLKIKHYLSTSLLGACSSLGQKYIGLEEAPSILRQNGLINMLADFAGEIKDLGDLYPKADTHLACWEFIQNVREITFASLQKNHLHITIGGDHSIAIGTVQATLLKYPQMKLVWVDAHGDINTPVTSLSGNLHGMPLAALLGLFRNPNGGPVLPPMNLLLVGIRDLDRAEKKIIEKLKIKMITAQEINQAPVKQLKIIEDWLFKSPQNPIHLSFDIDSLDPEFAPATGIRVPNGLSLDFAKKLVQTITKTESLVALDLVELNPLKANSPEELSKTITSAKEILLNALRR